MELTRRRIAHLNLVFIENILLLFSIKDVRTMIKYSITFNLMEECEDKQTYEDLVTRGVSHVIRQDRAYKKKNCTFEPGLYHKHTPAGEEFSIEDGKTMIKYSITSNIMKECEDKHTYEDLVTRGYLAHRVIRTLRPHFRSQISCYINEYGLPSEIVEKFRNLLSRSFEDYETGTILILKYGSLMNLCWGIDVITQDRAYKKKNCTFEPGLYQEHTPAGEEFSIEDVRTMIKYSITFNLMKECEDKQEYEDLVTRGYLAHRRPRTLRRHFRTQILCNINEYGLPSETVEKFRNLQS
ncbi:hypothetical protein QAD02_023868 [Eretmocerus hayati]|uniref:Uncharacterized protein n=1 Tax=Eretmocerus hayati TaxID=131215 RepID=A0ACC2PX58_9HYME|nr:hypothetical protein QAD02_023868 [Eretmocerus hayati]